MKITLEAKIIVDEELASEANSILEDVVEFAQTSAILAVFRDKFGNSFEEYEQTLKNGFSRAVISTLISSMENSAIICLGRIFDAHKKSARLRNVNDRLKNSMRSSQLGAGFALIFLRGMNCEFDDNDPIAGFSNLLMQKIIEMESLYDASGFCSLRNSHVGHANLKNRKDNVQKIIGIDSKTYMHFSIKLLEILFHIKHCLNPIESLSSENISRSAQNFIDDTVESARTFTRDSLRIENM